MLYWVCQLCDRNNDDRADGEGEGVVLVWAGLDNGLDDRRGLQIQIYIFAYM